MKKSVKILVYICVVFLVIYNVTLIIQKIVEPSKIPNFLGYKNFVILSGSMKKTLNIGDIIFVRKKAEITENDIISFREKGTIITHRVIEKIDQNGKIFYRTKGDANTMPDVALVPEENVEGVYSFKFAKLGKIIMFLQTRRGIITLCIILLIAYILVNKTTKNNQEKGKHST